MREGFCVPLSSLNIPRMVTTLKSHLKRTSHLRAPSANHFSLSTRNDECRRAPGGDFEHEKEVLYQVSPEPSPHTPQALRLRFRHHAADQGDDNDIGGDDDKCCEMLLFQQPSPSLCVRRTHYRHLCHFPYKPLLPAFLQINDRLEFPLELNMHPYTKEGRAATAATEEAAQRQDRQATTGDVAGEDGIGDGDDDDVTEVSVWFFLVATSVVEKGQLWSRVLLFLRWLLLSHPLFS